MSGKYLQHSVHLKKSEDMYMRLDLTVTQYAH